MRYQLRPRVQEPDLCGRNWHFEVIRLDADIRMVCLIDKVLMEAWRQFYNERRPHSTLSYQPPAAIRREWCDTDSITQRLTN